MKNFLFDLFLRFVLIPFFVCVEFFSSFSNEIGCTICITERGDSFVWSQSYCISHCSSILIWSDSMQKSFHTFKIRHILERNSTRKKNVFKFNFVRQYFDFIVGLRGRRGGYVIHSSIALHQGRRNRWGQRGQRDHASSPQILTDQSTKRGRLSPSQ